MRDFTLHVSNETAYLNIRYSRPYREGDESGANPPDIESIKAQLEKYLDIGIALNPATRPDQ